MNGCPRRSQAQSLDLVVKLNIYKAVFKIAFSSLGDKITVSHNIFAKLHDT